MGISGNPDPMGGNSGTLISINDLPSNIAQQHLSELIFAPIGEKVPDGPTPVVEGEEISIDILFSEEPNLLL